MGSFKGGFFRHRVRVRVTVRLTNQMNFWKNFTWPSTPPPSFSKNYIAFFYEGQIVWNACTWFPEIGTTLMTLPSLFPSLPAPVLSSATQIICRAVSKRSDHITSTWVAFFPSFPQHSYVIHQGWTRKLFFSRSGAGRGGARPTSMGRGGEHPPPPGRGRGQNLPQDGTYSNGVFDS